MIEEAPRIQHRPFERPAAALVDALRGTPTGFIVDALGGSGALRAAAPGTVGFAVGIAGHPVASGDVIVADQDGVVVVPQARFGKVIARLPAIRKAEADMDQAVRDGLRVPAFLAKDRA